MMTFLTRLTTTMTCAAVPLLVLATNALAAVGLGASAPEIDGPAGVAAVALLVSAGLIAYRRFKK